MVIQFSGRSVLSKAVVVAERGLASECLATYLGILTLSGALHMKAHTRGRCVYGAENW